MSSQTPLAPTAASDLLEGLRADRENLARVVNAPRWFYPALGVIVAFYVGSPIIGTDFGMTAITPGIVILLMLSLGSARVRRMRFRWRGALAIAVLIAVVLALFSVSLGLNAMEMPWWSIVPAAAAFVSTLAFGAAFDRARRGDVRRGN